MKITVLFVNVAISHNRGRKGYLFAFLGIGGIEKKKNMPDGQSRLYLSPGKPLERGPHAFPQERIGDGRNWSMLKNLQSAFVLAAAVGLFATAASADTVTYNFLSNTPITLPNTPLTSINAEPGGTVVQSAADGLGVDSHNNGLFGSGLFAVVDPDPKLINVNSAGVPEFIQFNFNPSVTVSSISFTAFTDDTTGNFFGIPFTNLNSGDNPVVSYSTDGTFFSPPFVTQITSGNTFSFNDIPTGTQIESLIIGAPSVFNGIDSFGIGSLTVNYTPAGGNNGSPQAGVATPLPSAASLGFVSLATLALVAGLRRKLAAQPA
jgi:hypothetical protein